MHQANDPLHVKKTIPWMFFALLLLLTSTVLAAVPAAGNAYAQVDPNPAYGKPGGTTYNILSTDYITYTCPDANPCVMQTGSQGGLTNSVQVGYEDIDDGTVHITTNSSSVKITVQPINSGVGSLTEFKLYKYDDDGASLVHTANYDNELHEYADTVISKLDVDENKFRINLYGESHEIGGGTILGFYEYFTILYEPGQTVSDTQTVTIPPPVGTIPHDKSSAAGLTCLNGSDTTNHISTPWHAGNKHEEKVDGPSHTKLSDAFATPKSGGYDVTFKLPKNTHDAMHDADGNIKGNTQIILKLRDDSGVVSVHRVDLSSEYVARTRTVTTSIDTELTDFKISIKVFGESSAVKHKKYKKNDSSTNTIKSTIVSNNVTLTVHHGTNSDGSAVTSQYKTPQNDDMLPTVTEINGKTNRSPIDVVSALLTDRDVKKFKTDKPIMCLVSEQTFNVRLPYGDAGATTDKVSVGSIKYNCPDGDTCIKQHGTSDTYVSSTLVGVTNATYGETLVTNSSSLSLDVSLDNNSDFLVSSNVTLYKYDGDKATEVIPNTGVDGFKHTLAISSLTPCENKFRLDVYGIDASDNKVKGIYEYFTIIYDDSNVQTHSVNPADGIHAIKDIISNAASCDVVSFEGGTYIDEKFWLYFEKPITLQPAPGANATFAGDIVMNIRSDNVVITGLGFHKTNSSGAVMYIGEKNILASYDNIKIHNNTFADTRGDGISRAGMTSVSNLHVTDNTFTNIGYDYADGLDDDAKATKIFNAMRLELNDPDKSYKISNSIIINNTITKTTGGGIKLADAKNVLVSGNVISEMPSSGISVSGDSDLVTIIGNTVNDTNNSLTLYNGTADITPDAAIKIWAKNNKNIQVLGNSITGGTNGILYCTGNCGISENSLTVADPKHYVDPSTKVDPTNLFLLNKFVNVKGNNTVNLAVGELSFSECRDYRQADACFGPIASNAKSLSMDIYRTFTSLLSALHQLFAPIPTSPLMSYAVDLLDLVTVPILVQPNHTVSVLNATKPLLFTTVDSRSISGNASSPSIRFSNNTFDSTGSAHVATPPDIRAEAKGVTMIILIHTVISDNGTNDWDGTFILPNIVAEKSILGINVVKSVEIGRKNHPLYFDQPIQIAFDGAAGKRAFVSHGDTTKEIAITCDSMKSPTNIAKDGPAKMCKVDKGDSLVIHSYTASVFSVGDTEKNTVKKIGGDSSDVDSASGGEPSTAPSQRTSSGGGGGGSGRTGVDVSGTGSGGAGVGASGTGLTLYGVSWDCNEKTTTIITNDGPVDVVIFGTSGKINVEPAETQNLRDRKIFVANYYDTLMSLRISAIDGRGLVSISETVRVDDCVGSKVFAKYVDGVLPPKVLTPTETDTTTASPSSDTVSSPPKVLTPTETDTAEIASFVDPEKDPYVYVKQYVTEPAYKEWFDESFSQYDGICGAVGLPSDCIEQYNSRASAVPQKPATPDVKPAPDPVLDPECDPGTKLVDGVCQVAKPDVIEDPKDEGLFGGGCLVATATYGTEMAPQVQLLREVRDSTLLSTESGTAFMGAFNSIYYSFSPAVADLEREHPAFRETVKLAITPMMLSLSILNHADIDSEHEMLFYGLGIIILNAGMYVAVPAAILCRLFKPRRRL